MKQKSLLIVLGSGGHTGELLLMLSKLDVSKFHKVFFVSSHNDVRSEHQAKEYFKDPKYSDRLEYLKIFRARNVGQSFLSSVPTTLFAMLHSVWLILKTRPNLIVTNGPGVALPLVYIGYILRRFQILVEFKILFIESYCRTKSISLAGRLIEPITDKFIVLWEQLQTRSRKYIGKIL